MVDWILISVICRYFLLTLVGVTAISTVVGLACGSNKYDNLSYKRQEAEDEWKYCQAGLKNGLRFGLCLGMVFAVTVTVSSVSNILIKTNIDRLKIKYTSPQVVEKIEGGALKVVDKLDKLIDKGIENLDSDTTD